MKALKIQFKKTLLSILVIFISGNAIIGQSEEKPATWFKVKKLAEKTWCIDDNGIANFYLVEGNKKALLIDNGMGIANVRDLVKTLTKLPLTIVITHGHPDHAGANYQFSQVYAHPLDFKDIEFYNQETQHKNFSANALKDRKLADNEIFTDTLNLNPTILKPIKEGYIFDLGGRKIKVIEVPGHTAGSIVLLDISNKMLFSGDNDNGLVWLFLKNCLPLETYLKSLEKLEKLTNKFTVIYPGHGEPLQPEFINEQIMCCKSILDGSCKGEEYKTFAGDGLLCRYKSAGVAYNPDNLFVKK